MVTALAWWTILLTKKNNEAFEAKVELIKSNFAKADMHNMNANNEYQELLKYYSRQKTMIYGESFVFAAMLIAGIWLIYKTFIKEFQLTNQQNNFLLSVTHELKTPLASIRLILDTFKKRKLNDDQKINLSNSAIEETKRLESIVENLLMSSRLQTEQKLNLETIRAHEIAEESIELIGPQYSEHKIINDIDPKLQIFVDRESFRIVFNNILENALKYSLGNQTITLRSFEKKDNKIIACEDLGIGIPDAEKQKVTDKFYRIGNEETRTTKGTGLGLYIVNEIVKKHNAILKISDNTPKGTVITITLPA